MKKILIVDDEKDIRDLIKERLVQNKYTVMTASTSQEALNFCKTERPDLVLLDVAMPQMDGYETCEKLKQDEKIQNIPILFLTGKDLDTQSMMKRCQDLSAYGCVSKLSTIEELLEKVKKIIG